MKQINEIKRMQQLAGLITESEFQKAQLNEDINTFEELKKAVDSLTSEYTGEDVSITEDDENEEIYIETFEKPVFAALLKKVKEKLKNNSNYKIDVDNIDKEDLTFEIIKK
jgi:hypothetical protein